MPSDDIDARVIFLVEYMKVSSCLEWVKFTYIEDHHIVDMLTVIVYPRDRREGRGKDDFAHAGVREASSVSDQVGRLYI